VVARATGRIHVAAALERHDAGRYRTRKPERVSDRDHPLAYFEAFAVPQSKDRERAASFDLDEGEVGRIVPADQHAADRPFLVADLHRDVRRSFDDVAVRRDQAVGPDEEPGADPAHGLLALASG